MRRLPVPTDPDVRRVLDRQVELMLHLAGEVMDGVTLDECLWRPTSDGWTVHQRDGRWFGELDEEPPDPPTPSLGWVMWHPIWWLSVLLADARGEPTPAAESIEWPGPTESLPTITGLWREWMDLLDGLSPDQLASPEHTGFPYRDERPFVHIAGWASMELTKNLSEMCQLRRIAQQLGST